MSESAADQFILNESRRNGLELAQVEMQRTAIEAEPLTLALIAQCWLKKLSRGQIHFDPCKVESRWLIHRGSTSERFKAVLNGNRKNRPTSKAA